MELTVTRRTIAAADSPTRHRTPYVRFTQYRKSKQVRSPLAVSQPAGSLSSILQVTDNQTFLSCRKSARDSRRNCGILLFGVPQRQAERTSPRYQMSHI